MCLGVKETNNIEIDQRVSLLPVPSVAVTVDRTGHWMATGKEDICVFGCQKNEIQSA